MHHRRTRALLATTTAVVGALTLAACGGAATAGNGAAADGGSWTLEDEIARTIELAQSDFVRDVLADGVVTSAERQEAVARFVECGAVQGVELTVQNLREGLAQLAGVSEEVNRARLEVFWGCAGAGGGYGDVLRLYDFLAVGATHIDYGYLRVACLRRHGLVSDGFTLAELEEILEPVIGGPESYEEARENPRWLSVEVLPGGGLDLVENPDWVAPPMVLPNGVSLDDGQGAECLWNPTG